MKQSQFTYLYKQLHTNDSREFDSDREIISVREIKVTKLEGKI